MKVAKAALRKHLWWLSISIAVLCSDQISKQWMVDWLADGRIRPFVPTINWALAFNDGAAFSFLSQAGGWQRWFLTVLSIVVSAFIVSWIVRIADKERSTTIALALVLGGAIGNLVDRVLFGYVIDFIDFYYPSAGACLPLFHRSGLGHCHWPTFNIADSAISVGAVLLLISAFWHRSTDDDPAQAN